MNIASILLWGFVATAVLTLMMSASQGMGLTRISMPFLLGTMITPNRDRAMVLGTAVHFINGWLFAILYALAFESWHRATWWLGTAIGLVHASFVLVVANADHTRHASADGQRVLWADSKSTTAATRISGPQLWLSHADCDASCACRIRRHPRCLLPTQMTREFYQLQDAKRIKVGIWLRERWLCSNLRTDGEDVSHLHFGTRARSDRGRIQVWLRCDGCHRTSQWDRLSGDAEARA